MSSVTPTNDDDELSFSGEELGESYTPAPTPSKLEPKPSSEPAKKKRKRAPRKPSDRVAPRPKKQTQSERFERIRKTHERKTGKVATELLEATIDTFAGSSLGDAINEANSGREECEAALRKIRATVRSTRAAPQAMREYAKTISALRESGADGGRDAKLLEGAAAAIEKLAAAAAQSEKLVEMLTQKFGKNSAHCLAVTRAAGDASAVGGGAVCVPSRLAAARTQQQLVAPSNRESLAVALSETGAALGRISEREHARMALVVGSDGSAAIETSTRPVNVLRQHNTSADYLPFSTTSDQVIVQQTADAHAQRRNVAARRIRNERVRNYRVIQAQALDTEALKAGAPIPLIKASQAGARLQLGAN